MKDKQSFLDQLNAALIERGVSDTDIVPYIERFDKYYDRMITDANTDPRALENIEVIADNIAAQISQRYEEINKLAERAMTAEPTPAVEEKQDDSQPEFRQMTVSDYIEPGVNIDDRPTAEADIAEITDEISKAHEAALEQNGTGQLQPSDGADLSLPDGQSDEDPNDAPMRLPDYIEEEPLGDTKAFYIAFFATLPITVPLALVLLAVFAGVWVGLAAAIVGLMAALVCVSAAGATVSLVGIVYGIIQLFDSARTPIGLYEIGLGVLVAGISILGGILIYNFAIRLLPFLIKQVYRFFLYVIRKLKQLFRYLRKESAKL